jgi:hypothetical protein
MSKSAHLRIVDVRAIVRLVGECRDLGDDPSAWRQHLLRTVAGLTGAVVASDVDLVDRGERPVVVNADS